MRKDFDSWNEEKKSLHEHAIAPHYREREIRWCHYGTNIGFEQDGTGTGKSRPALILRGFSRSVCLVVPLTTSSKENPYHIPLGMINGKRAWAIISQLRLVDTKRLYTRIGILDESAFKAIRKAVKDLL